jgi:aspartate carbamoyltransferase catalytic subunit
MCDIIMARVYKQTTIDGLAKHSTVPVINGMSDEAHPVQILTDLYTIMEKKGPLKGLKLTYLGDGKGNTAQDMAIGCATMGVHFTLACPDYSKHALLQNLDFGLPLEKYWNTVAPGLPPSPCRSGPPSPIWGGDWSHHQPLSLR